MSPVCLHLLDFISVASFTFHLLSCSLVSSSPDLIDDGIIKRVSYVAAFTASLQSFSCIVSSTIKLLAQWNDLNIKAVYGFHNSWINHLRFSKPRRCFLRPQKPHSFSAARYIADFCLNLLPTFIWAEIAGIILLISSAAPIEKARCLPAVKSRKVTSEDSGGTPSGESIFLDQQSLKLELENAVKEENYTEAARIRDSLRVYHEEIKASVLAANARFYNAFRMQTLWINGEKHAAYILGQDEYLAMISL